MRPMIELLTQLYALCALLLALYTAGLAALLLAYWRHDAPTPSPPPPDDWPGVTLQIPVYNEREVVRGLLDAIARLDYPPHKLTLQLLDDSTDGTTHTLAHHAERLRARGLGVSHLRREQRDGYKAGALAHGLAHITDAYVLIFDADFVPPPDFLRRTLPHLLMDERLAFVQTRWSHLNAAQNGLTAAQALAIDAHFIVEQSARDRAGWLLPFNGTGGLWRVEALREAGGWSDATLTEDLDMSYRAQLSGWRARYLPEVAAPGQLPHLIAAYKRQQTRWAKGSTQCLRRLAGPVWRSERPLMQRIMALHHLAQYLPHLWMLTLLMLTPPLLLLDALPGAHLAPLGALGMLPPLLMALGQWRLYGHLKHLRALPVLILVHTGITWHTARGVLSGLFGAPGGEFQRTPKGTAQAAPLDASDLRLLRALPQAETALALYALLGAHLAAQHQPEVLPYLLVYAAAFGLVALWTLSDRAASQREPHGAFDPHGGD